MPNESGIYIIINLINSKVYIGSSINMRERTNRHFSDLYRNAHYNTLLQRSYNKYGKEAFIVKVLEICDKDVLLSREQFYLDKYKSYDINNGYNILTATIPDRSRIPDSVRKRISLTLTGRKPTQETLDKIKKSFTQERREKMSSARKGKCVKSHCSKGHEFTIENSHVYIDKFGKSHKTCVTCRKNRCIKKTKEKAELRLQKRLEKAKRLESQCIHGHILNTLTKTCDTCTQINKEKRKKYSKPKTGKPCGRVPKEYCPKGHKYAYTPSGKKVCRECYNATQRIRRSRYSKGV